MTGSDLGGAGLGGQQLTAACDAAFDDISTCTSQVPEQSGGGCSGT